MARRGQRKRRVHAAPSCRSSHYLTLPRWLLNAATSPDYAIMRRWLVVVAASPLNMLLHDGATAALPRHDKLGTGHEPASPAAARREWCGCWVGKGGGSPRRKVQQKARERPDMSSISSTHRNDTSDGSRMARQAHT